MTVEVLVKILEKMPPETPVAISDDAYPPSYDAIIREIERVAFAYEKVVIYPKNE